MHSKKHNTIFHRRNLRGKLMQILDVPSGAVTSDGYVEIVGDRETAVNGCRGVLAYCDTCIILRVKRGCIRIVGESLMISSLVQDRITILGTVHSVHVCDKEQAVDD